MPTGAVFGLPYSKSAVAALSSADFQTLPDGATINWDLAQGNAQVILGGNRTLANPTSMVAGQRYFLVVKQDATGNRSILSWGTAYRFLGGSPPTFSTAANAVDIIAFDCDGTLMYEETFAANQAIIPSLPTDIAGLVLWLKADAITGVANGAQFSPWNDSSGNGNNATQSTGAYQPVYNTNVVNGLPVVHFAYTAGVGMTTPLSLSTPFTVFIVYRQTDAASANRRALQGSNNWLIGPYAGTHQYYDGAFISGASVVQNAWVYGTVVQNANGATFYINGLSQGTNTSTGGPGTFDLAGTGAYSEPLGGDIAEIFVYNVALSTGQVTAMWDYLKNKYAL